MTKTVLYTLFLSTLFCSSAFGATLVVEGGTVHPMTAEPFVGNVVMEDGTITAAGADAVAPAGATRIDATGLHVYPGMMDALTQLGLVEINSVPATDDQAEMGTYNPHLTAATAVHPASDTIPVARTTGITHALVAPEADDGGVIPGQAALMNLDGWTVEEMAIDPVAAMIIEWPGVVTRRFDFSTFSMKETPFKEAEENAEKAQNELRDWFDAARHYAQATAADGGRANRDLRLEALARITSGDQRVIVVAQSKRDIEAAVAFADEQSIEMVLAGARDAREVASLLAEKQIPVILGMTQSLPQWEDDPYDHPYSAPGELVAAGLRIAFASGAGGGFGPGGPHGVRTIPYEAAMAVPYGLAAEDAMRALTLWPAVMLGLGDRIGSIDEGKIGNLVVTDGSPLELTSQVKHLIIDGREVSTDNRHRRLYETYRAR